MRTRHPEWVTLRIIAVAACVAVGLVTAAANPATSVSRSGGVVARAASGALAGAVSHPTTDSLSGVSCTGPASCIAVGSRSGRTLAERWNGSTWTLLATPSPGNAGNTLSGISCSSGTRCVAVGSYRTSARGPVPLAETWNGSTWRLSAGTGSGGILNGVSCVSAAWCMAVGFGSDNQNTAERWNGTSWRSLPVPNIGGPSSILSAVSCTAQASCIAVGSGAPDDETNLPYSVVWNGSSWRELTTPGRGEEISAGLNGVSCAAGDCVAVGSGGGVSGADALALRWNGTAWQQLTMPPAAQGQPDILAAVSCPGASWCMAVGSTKTGTTSAKPLTERWTGGSWQAVPAASPPGDIYPTGLSGVSCASASSCVAGGTYTIGDGSFLGDAQLTLAELWNGTSWRIPLPPGYLIQLRNGGVSNFHVSWYGSQRGQLAAGVTAVAIAADQVTGGYWTLASNGGVANYNAPWWGSQRGSLPAGTTARGIAADPQGPGYWVLDSNGAVASFNAPSYGSEQGALTSPVAGITADPATGGYWILNSNGGVSNFHAPWYGSQRGHLAPGVKATGITADRATGGYWILDSNGGVANYHAPSYGSLAGTPQGKDPAGLAGQ